MADNDDQDGTLMEAREREPQNMVNKIKQHMEDAASMIEEVKTARKEKVADEDR
jgi:hypothetical protein